MISTDFVMSLAKVIEFAASAALTELIAVYPESFYYISLITTGEGHPPISTAWPSEALSRAVQAALVRDQHQESNPNTARYNFEWSYGESPYFGFGDGHFSDVKRIIEARPQFQNLDIASACRETSLRLLAAESAIANMDRAGFFSVFGQRESLVINVEVMPPCEENTTRGIRLNPPEAISRWLDDVAEPI